MTDATDRNVDHLRILGLAYYIMAGLTAAAPIPMHLFFLATESITQRVMAGAPGEDPELMRVILLSAQIALGVIWEVLAILMYLAGRFLRSRRHPTFCIAAAGLGCFQPPWGTILGVWTIMTLGKPEVRALFAPDSAYNPV